MGWSGSIIHNDGKFQRVYQGIEVGSLQHNILGNASNESYIFLQQIKILCPRHNRGGVIFAIRQVVRI